MADTNIVTLNTSSYNQIKSENFKLELFVENLLLEARLSDDHQELVFDTDKVATAFKFSRKCEPGSAAKPFCKSACERVAFIISM